MSIAAGLTNLGVLAIVVHPIPFFNERSPVRRAPRGVGYHNDPAEPGGGLGLRHLADSVDKRYVMALRLTLRPRWRRFSMPRFTWDGRPCTILHVFALGLGGSIPGRPAFQAEFFGLSPFCDPGTRLHDRNARQAGQPGLCRLALRHDRQLPPRLCHLVRGLAAGGPSGPVCVQACGVDYHSWLYWPTRRGAGL